MSLHQLKKMVIDDGADPRLRAGFQRGQRAVLDARDRTPAVTGAKLFVEMCTDTRSPAAWLLDAQEMTRQGPVNVIVHGSVKEGSASRLPSTIRSAGTGFEIFRIT